MESYFSFRDPDTISSIPPDDTHSVSGSRSHSDLESISASSGDPSNLTREFSPEFSMRSKLATSKFFQNINPWSK